jgi:hypothetical protein
MTMRPAIAERILGSAVHGSLHGKLQAVTSCPNVWHVVALRGNRIFLGKNFSSSSWLLDPGIWMTLKDVEKDSLAKLKPAQHGCFDQTKGNAQGP